MLQRGPVDESITELPDKHGFVFEVGAADFAGYRVSILTDLPASLSFNYRDFKVFETDQVPVASDHGSSFSHSPTECLPQFIKGNPNRCHCILTDTAPSTYPMSVGSIVRDCFDGGIEKSNARHKQVFGTAHA